EPGPPPPAKPIREAEQVSGSRAAQQAAGSGGSKEAGNSTAAVTTSSESASKNTQLREIWGARIRNRILRAQRYPRRASGKAKVVIEITIAPSGQLLSHRLVRSSGEAVFDDAALRTITSIRRFPKAPRGYTGGQFRFNAPMTFNRKL
ncbi:MAG: TonB C-terminal domain-containing protein, partial [Epibacterium sp.]|nr:TonB C-terminal domain-containing protein [Epibacterium sp.]NQX72622.1 TonB C-terminal domain-containing protein [Epibacterium sp.]